MLHEKLELRRILKQCLKQMNDIPYGQRDKEVVDIRNSVNKKVDDLAFEIHKELAEYENVS